jgi:predicted transcriptional regulator
MSYNDLSRKEQIQFLKEMREEHAETVQRTQDLLKEQNAIRRKIEKAFGGASKTVPQLAESTGLPTHEVLWHVTALKKYDLVVEDGMEGYYDVLYKRAED